MKRIITAIITIIVLPASIALAQSNSDVVPVDEQTSITTASPSVTENSDKYFNLELTRESQSAFNKRITYILTVTPTIDSPKTQILWDVPTTFKVYPKHNEFVNLTEGQQYTFKASISPQKEGTYDITANVTSWQTKANSTNSISSPITIGKNLLVQPVDSAYTVSLMLVVVLVIAFAGGLIFWLYKSSGKIIGRIKLDRKSVV